MASHEDVAQEWADQSRAERSGHNMFFEGQTIYSYGRHFPIARLVEVKGRTIALFTTRDYSTSTARHIGIASGAASRYEKRYVERPDRAVTEADFDASVAQAHESVQKGIRARGLRDFRFGEARKALANANWLRENYGLKREPITFEDVLNTYPGRFDRKGYEGP